MVFYKNARIDETLREIHNNVYDRTRSPKNNLFNITL